MTALIRSLPKAVRRHLVPAPDRAREALAGIGPDDGPLLDVLARRLATLAGEPVAPGDFDLTKVPDHLRVRFRIEDGDGGEVASGRDLGELRRRLGDRVRRAVADAAPGIERRGLTTWDIGTLPRTVDVEADGRPVRGYPALVDEGDSVAVRVMTSADDQARAMRAGTRRLLVLALPAARREAERRLRAVPALAAAPRARPVGRRPGRRLRGRRRRPDRRQRGGPGVGRRGLRPADRRRPVPAGAPGGRRRGPGRRPRGRGGDPRRAPRRPPGPRPCSPRSRTCGPSCARSSGPAS